METERLISADGFIEDIKAEIMNLYLDGRKGTPRPREELYAIIDRINEQPTVNAMELPCKIGDWVWAIRSYHGKKHPQRGIVSDMYFSQDMRLQIVVKHIARGEWGKTVFATDKEAYAAILEVT